MSEPEVWYVSYGSNMSAARLGCYLHGGCPPGARRTYPGARDPRLPRHSRPVLLPGRVYFAGRSRVWGGGIAFYDHVTPGPTPARAYLLTAGQLADVAAQEMHRLPDAGDPLEQVIVAGRPHGLPGGRHRVGPGHYETLLEVGWHAGAPMLTFTAPHGYAAVPHTRPSHAYLAMLRAGLCEAHGWTEQRARRHLAALVPPDGTGAPVRAGAGEDQGRPSAR